MLSLKGVAGNAITESLACGADCASIFLQPITMQLCISAFLRDVYDSPLILFKHHIGIILRPPHNTWLAHSKHIPLWQRSAIMSAYSHEAVAGTDTFKILDSGESRDGSAGAGCRECLQQWQPAALCWPGSTHCLLQRSPWRCIPASFKKLPSAHMNVKVLTLFIQRNDFLLDLWLQHCE